MLKLDKYPYIDAGRHPSKVWRMTVPASKELPRIAVAIPPGKRDSTLRVAVAQITNERFLRTILFSSADNEVGHLVEHTAETLAQRSEKPVDLFLLPETPTRDGEQSIDITMILERGKRKKTFRQQKSIQREAEEITKRFNLALGLSYVVLKGKLDMEGDCFSDIHYDIFDKGEQKHHLTKETFEPRILDVRGRSLMALICCEADHLVEQDEKLDEKGISDILFPTAVWEGGLDRFLCRIFSTLDANTLMNVNLLLRDSGFPAGGSYLYHRNSLVGNNCAVQLAPREIIAVFDV